MLEDPESYASSIIATGRVSHAGQVKADDPDDKGYPVLPGWELGMRLTTSPHKKLFINITTKMFRKGLEKNEGAFCGGGQGPEGAVASYIDG